MIVKLIPARAIHAAIIAELIRELALSIKEKSPISEKGARKYLITSGSRVLLAKVGKETVGLISYSMRLGLYHSAASCLIEELIVRKQFRGRGIADKLVAKVIALARKARCAEISVSTEKRNRKAIALYKKHGMKEEFLYLERHLKHS